MDKYLKKTMSIMSVVNFYPNNTAQLIKKDIIFIIDYIVLCN